MNAPTGGQVTEPRPVSFDIPTYVGLPEERRRLALVVAEFIFPEEWEGLVNSIRDAEVEHYMNENPLTPADKRPRPSSGPRSASASATVARQVAASVGAEPAAVRAALAGALAAERQR